MSSGQASGDLAERSVSLVLRIYGSENLEPFLARCASRLPASVAIRRFDRADGLGSGANLFLIKGEDATALTETALEWFGQLKEEFSELTAIREPTELDIGVFVDPEIVPMKSVHLPPSLVRQLSGLAIAVRISFYFVDAESMRNDHVQ